jgi:hypothetical protein
MHVMACNCGVRVEQVHVGNRLCNQNHRAGLTSSQAAHWHSTYLTPESHHREVNIFRRAEECSTGLSTIAAAGFGQERASQIQLGGKWCHFNMCQAFLHASGPVISSALYRPAGLPLVPGCVRPNAESVKLWSAHEVRPRCCGLAWPQATERQMKLLTVLHRTLQATSTGTGL